MIEQNDDWCKIITVDEDARKRAKAQLYSVNISMDDVNKLLDERHLEVRKFRSETAGMGHCVVVKCSRGTFWNIPNIILERVEKP